MTEKILPSIKIEEFLWLPSRPKSIFIMLQDLSNVIGNGIGDDINEFNIVGRRQTRTFKLICHPHLCETDVCQFDFFELVSSDSIDCFRCYVFNPLTASMHFTVDDFVHQLITKYGDAVD